MGPFWGSRWDGFGPIMMLPMIFIWILIIVIGILLVRKLWRESPHNQLNIPARRSRLSGHKETA